MKTINQDYKAAAGAEPVPVVTIGIDAAPLVATNPPPPPGGGRWRWTGSECEDLNPKPAVVDADPTTQTATE